MNLDHDFVQVCKLSEDQKKKCLHQKWNTFFPQIQMKTKKNVFTKNGTLFPQFQVTPTLRCTPESNYWGRCRSKSYSNYWGDTVKLLKDISPQSSPGFGTPGFRPAPFMNLGCNNEEKLIVVDYIEMTMGCYYDIRCCKNHLKLHEVYAKI